MLAVFLIVSIFALIAHFYWKRKRLANSLPPGPPPRFLVGNLFQIDRQDPKKTFLKWHKKYGPIYTVWFGHTPNVFVTGHELLQELFVKRGDEFADRPNNFIFSHFTHGQYGISSVSGEAWKEQRRFTLQVLRNFGLGRKVMEEKISAESVRLVAEVENSLTSQSGNSMNIKPLLDVCVGSVISSVVLGHPYDYGDPKFLQLKRGMDRTIQLLAHVSVLLLDSFPWLRFIPFYGRLGYNEMMAENKQVLKMLSEEIKNHKSEIGLNMEPTDYTEAYLLELNRRSESGANMGWFGDWQLTCVLADLYGAGLETTVTTLNWAVLTMMCHPDIQEKVQKEIQDVIGSERLPNMTDRTQMPYVCATIQELQRYANILAINLPHATNKDVEVNGYKIPKGISVIPQISVVHVDDTIYSKPSEFNPDRFLEEDKKTLKKSDTTLIPFSLGKRICLGEGLARMELFIIFTSLLQKFSFSCVQGEPKPDLRPVVAFSTQPKPYKVCVTRRHI